MLVYVGFAQPDEWVQWAHAYAHHARRFEQAAGGRVCLTVPFQHFTPALLRRLQPDAIILSGFARSFQDYEVRDFYPVADCIEQAEEIPILALCGSHQLLGFLFNGALRSSPRLYDEPIRARRPGEPILNPDYHPEHYMERGFFELTLHEEDPLFEGCRRPPIVYESHYCEIKTLPEGFRLLASTPECRIQTMRHETRPLIGLQFHPEDYSERFPDGRRILENFLRLP